MSFTVSLRAELKGASQRALAGVQAAQAARAGEVQVRAERECRSMLAPSMLRAGAAGGARGGGGGGGGAALGSGGQPPRLL